MRKTFRMLSTTLSLALLVTTLSPASASAANITSKIVIASDMVGERTNVQFIEGTPGDTHLVYTYQQNGNMYKAIENASDDFRNVECQIFQLNENGIYVENSTQCVSMDSEGNPLITIKSFLGDTEQRTIDISTITPSFLQSDSTATKIDVLGNAYEYLIGQFAANAGKKAGEFYTPAGPSELLALLACDGLTDISDAADPTCGSGSLLLRLSKHANVRRYWGQELTAQTYNLCRMNMILRGIKYQNFHIHNGDTLADDSFEGKEFRVQVANPPYSANIAHPELMADDPRFNTYGKFAPKSKTDFAFVQHMVYHMDDDGRIAVLLPHGVLFRGAGEAVIRKHLIEKLNVIDAIIGLPANLFFGTSIPVCIIVCKKNRNGNSDNILFIDASKEFQAGKKQNVLTDENIQKILKTYQDRVDVEKYAHVATMKEIEENDFNLNIPRYVDTSEEEIPVDLEQVTKEINDISNEIEETSNELKKYFEQLGLAFPNIM